jgi:pimeloyl-ACP methyl ester carboxylesterase
MTYWQTDDHNQIYFELYDQHKTGQNLLLLPGLLGTVSNQWRLFVEPLAARYRLLLVDLRGHGRSEMVDTALIPDRMVQDIIGLLSHLGFESTHVSGYDMGGYLGLMLHLFEPRRVETLFMHATKFYWSKSSADSMRQQLEPETIQIKAPAFADALALEHGGSRWRSLVRRAADLVSYLADHGLTERMAASAQCPVMVSVGDRDKLVPVQEAFRLSRALTFGSLLVVPSASHPLNTVDGSLLLTAMLNHQQGNRVA